MDKIISLGKGSTLHVWIRTHYLLCDIITWNVYLIYISFKKDLRMRSHRYHGILSTKSSRAGWVQVKWLPVVVCAKRVFVCWIHRFGIKKSTDNKCTVPGHTSQAEMWPLEVVGNPEPSFLMLKLRHRFVLASTVHPFDEIRQGMMAGCGPRKE